VDGGVAAGLRSWAGEGAAEPRSKYRARAGFRKRTQPFVLLLLH
jgi:hypothetical protein